MWNIIRFICALLLVIGFTESLSTFIPPLLHKQSPENDSSTTSPPLIHKSSRQIDGENSSIISTDKPRNNNNNDGNYSNSVAVPSEFPRNESEYHFLNNATVLKNLSAHQDSVEVPPLLDGASDDHKLAEESSNEKVDTEVGDLLAGGSFADDKTPAVNNEGKGEENGKLLEDSGKAKSVEIPPELIVNETPQEEEYPKSEVEWLQNGNDNEDIRLRNNAVDENLLQPLAATSAVDSSSDSRNGEQPLVQGRYAAILAGAFVIIAVAGYIALLSWRRYLENRYGNREMLVNDEDIYDPNDLKHFSI